ncbi:MAG: glycosyltransferase [Micrococcales bacterium]|nr:glycosyltransferase [Micrococcales bacterium]
MTTAGLAEPDLVAAGPGLADVTAVVVSAGLTGYLEASLQALAAQTRLPAVVLLVDVGGPAGAAELLDATFAGVGVRAARTRTTAAALGAAVDAGLAKLALASAETAWLWLLHDDCAPAPTALAELVDAAGKATSVAVVGPKQRTWTDPERLVEVGMTTTRSGRRVGAAVPGELDQGQHDGSCDVLAVGTAGVLVRWDVWRQVGGTDPALGPFGDGLDLSRRARLAGHRVVVAPRAVVRHARASYLGLRPRDGTPRAVGDGPRGDPRRSLGARRKAHGYARLVGVVWWAVPFVAAGLFVAAPVRAVVRLAMGESAAAGRELVGGWGALARPLALWRGRRSLAHVSVLPRRSLWPLQATWRQVWAAVSERRASQARPPRPRPSRLEEAELAALAAWRRVALAVVLVALVALTAVAVGDLVARVSAGARLAGGALAFAPSSWDQAWSAATSPWVGEGLGSAGPADPLARVLAVASLAVGGNVRLVVAVVLLGGVVLAGWGAWVAAGVATRSVALRGWAAVVWALAPGLLTATGTGRVGAAVAHVLLPWVVFGVARSLGVQRVDVLGARLDAAPDDDPVEFVQVGDDLSVRPAASTAEPSRPRPSRLALAATSLVLAVVWAGAPSLVVPSLVALVVVGVAAGSVGRRLGFVVVPGIVLLAPLYVAAVGRDGGWRLALADPGLADVAEPAGAVHRLLGVPVADAVPSWVPGSLGTWWFGLAGVVVLVVAFVGLVRGGRAVWAGWVVAVLALAWATVLVALPVVRAVDQSGPVFLGPTVALAQAGLLAAALVGADRARRPGPRVWRTVAVVAGVVAVVAPATSWLWHPRDGAGQVHAVTGSVVPAVGQQAFVRGSRVLLLVPGADGTPLRYRLLSADGVQASDQSAAAATGRDRGIGELESVVAALAAGSSVDESGALGALAVAYVQVPVDAGDQRAQLVGRLDATVGLERVTDGASGTLWRVAGVDRSVTVTSWARLVPASGGPADVALPLAGDGTQVRSRIVGVDFSRTVLLAERAGPHWQASVDGRRLEPVTVGWRQGFALPPGVSGELVVGGDDGVWRTGWLVLQGLVVGAALLVIVAEAVRGRRWARR